MVAKSESARQMNALCMLEHAALRLNSAKLLKLAGAILLATIVPIAFGQGSVLPNGQVPVSATSAQPTVPDWQRAAGGKMEFEVASIRQNNGKFVPPNFAMNPPDDSYVPTGGLFIADYPVEVYIEFAYKFWPSNEQKEAMLAHLPKWVATDSFEIRARAAGNPTKDQMRLMMQSLLAERFGLVMHFETQETPVLAMTLVKPGKLGPRLRPHAQGPSCDVAVSNPTSGKLPKGEEIFPPECGVYTAIGKPNRVIEMGARNTTLEMIAYAISSFAQLGRPVVDKTGLGGRFDLAIEWTRQPNSSQTAGVDSQVDPQGTTLMEAVQEQLGLRLKPGKVPLKVIVVDHIQKPSDN
jgi:bla regulator protein blaR1